MLQEPVACWIPVTNDAGEIILDENQQPTYEDPIEIKVFWIDSVEEYLSGRGENRISRSIVFVGIDMPPWGTLLYRAPLSSLTQQQEDDPKNELARVETVQRFDKIPTLKYMKTNQFVRKAYI